MRIFRNSLILGLGLFGGCSETPYENIFTDLVTFGLNDVSDFYGIAITDVAVSSSGEVFCCDFGNSQILRFEADGSFIESWGRENARSSSFNKPRSISIDSENYIFVACKNSVVVLDLKGTVLNEIEMPFHPIDIEAESGNFYVVGYSKEGIVHKFSKEGKWLKTWGEIFQSEYQRIRKMYSGGVIEIVNGEIWLSYKTSYKISKFSTEGLWITDIKRDGFDFTPRFEINGKRTLFKSNSSVSNIVACASQGIIINEFFLRNTGRFLDFYDYEGNLLKSDVQINVHLINNDQNGNTYYLRYNNESLMLIKGVVKWEKFLGQVPVKNRE